MNPDHPPDPRLEAWLAQVWRQIMGLPNVGREDDFFELGGNLVLATVMVNRIDALLGQRLPLDEFLEAPTIAQLAQHLAERFPREVEVFRLSTIADEGAPQTLIPPVPSRVLTTIDFADYEHRIKKLPLKPSNASPAKKNPPCVFVLCSARTGSTLLRVMLAGHPELFAPPELELLMFEDLRQRAAAFSGPLWFWRSGLVRAVMQLKSCPAETAVQLLQEHEDQGTTTQAAYGLLQKWAGDRLLVDKSPPYALDLSTLQRAELYFEDARYIHLVRHPAAAIRSSEQVGMHHFVEPFFDSVPTSPPEALAELGWVVCQQNIVKFLALIPPERQLRVRFEDLLADTRGTLDGVCRFLGKPFHPDLLCPHDDPHRRMTDGLYPRGAMLGDPLFNRHKKVDATVATQWQTSNSPIELSPVTLQIARELGYAAPASAPTPT